MADESKGTGVVLNEKPAEVKRAWADEAEEAETSSTTPAVESDDPKLELDSLSIKDEGADTNKILLLDEPNESDIQTVSVMNLD